ncbi:MAG: PhnD/SsuA/transferrin family substrate-binding protein [Planctomycetes bacterium]|nr:PhnD/SsuA/transferrin family substrate-binding protein [Planctomycetota bacterium]
MSSRLEAVGLRVLCGLGQVRRFSGPILVSIVALCLGAYSAYRIAMGLPSDPRPRPAAWLDLRERSAIAKEDLPEATTRQESLRIAVAPVISPELSSALYEGVFRRLGERTDRRLHVCYGKSYGDVNNLVRYRQCDLAVICDFALVRGQQQFGMEILAVPVVRGSIVFHSLIVTQASSPATSLFDLRDTRFASSDLLSASGWLYPMVAIRGDGADPGTFFSRHVITGSHDRSILAVLSQCVDGAAVDSQVYDYMVEREPGIASAIRVIERSSPFGAPPFVVHPAIDPELRIRMQAALLDMHEDEEGRRALLQARIDRFVIPPAGLYDSVQALVASLDSGE